MGNGRIRIPFKRRVQLLCQSLLPVVAFFGCAAIVGYLWVGHVMYTGLPAEAYAPTVDANSTIIGKLIPTGGPDVVEFQTVKKGDIIALMGSAGIDEQRNVIKKEQEHIRSQISSIQAEAEFNADTEANRIVATRLQVLELLSRLEVQLSETQGLLETTRVEFLGLREIHQRWVRLAEKGIDSPYEMLVSENAKKVAEEKGRSYLHTTRELKTKISEAKARLASLPKVPDARLAALIAPIEKEIDVKAAMLRQLDVQQRDLTVTAPISGTITMVHRRPGQAVAAGDPIVTIAATDAEYFLTFIRLDQVRPPQGGWLNQAVSVWIPNNSSKRTVNGYITDVGGRALQMPLQHQRDPKVPEIGLPVAIRVPKAELAKLGVQVYPGQLVHITLLGEKATNISADAKSQVTLNQESGTLTAVR